MARAKKTGLEYFPHDTSMSNDTLVERLEYSHGLTGYAVLNKLYEAIYRDGYFIRWTKEEEEIFSMKQHIDGQTLKSCINRCLELGIFSLTLYKTHSILTSEGIQKRFLFIRKKNADVLLAEYCLVSDEPISEKLPPKEQKQETKAENIPQNDTESGESDVPEAHIDDKVKENKIKESTQNEIKRDGMPIGAIDVLGNRFAYKDRIDQTLQKWNLFAEEMKLSRILYLPTYREELLIQRLREPQFDIDKIIAAIRKQPHLLGDNGIRWKIDFEWIIKDEKYIKILEGVYRKDTFIPPKRAQSEFSPFTFECLSCNTTITANIIQVKELNGRGFWKCSNCKREYKGEEILKIFQKQSEGEKVC
jgi:hypothetical protein